MHADPVECTEPARIAQVFEALWGTNELLSSFDSINILKPGQHESSTDGWLHVDQAPLRKGIACIQGLINMVDVGPDTGQQSCLFCHKFVLNLKCHIAASLHHELCHFQPLAIHTYYSMHSEHMLLLKGVVLWLVMLIILNAAACSACSTADARKSQAQAFLQAHCWSNMAAIHHMRTSSKTQQC